MDALKGVLALLIALVLVAGAVWHWAPRRAGAPTYTVTQVDSAVIAAQQAARDTAAHQLALRMAGLHAVEDSLRALNAALARRPPVTVHHHDTGYVYVPDSTPGDSAVVPAPVAERLALLEHQVPLLQAVNDSLRAALGAVVGQQASVAAENRRLAGAVTRANAQAHGAFHKGLLIGAGGVVALAVGVRALTR